MHMLSNEHLGKLTQTAIAIITILAPRVKTLSPITMDELANQVDLSILTVETTVQEMFQYFSASRFTSTCAALALIGYRTGTDQRPGWVARLLPESLTDGGFYTQLINSLKILQVQAMAIPDPKDLHDMLHQPLWDVRHVLASGGTPQLTDAPPEDDSFGTSLDDIPGDGWDRVEDPIIEVDTMAHAEAMSRNQNLFMQLHNYLVERAAFSVSVRFNCVADHLGITEDKLLSMLRVIHKSTGGVSHIGPLRLLTHLISRRYGEMPNWLRKLHEESQTDVEIEYMENRLNEIRMNYDSDFERLSTDMVRLSICDMFQSEEFHSYVANDIASITQGYLMTRNVVPTGLADHVKRQGTTLRNGEVIEITAPLAHTLLEFRLPEGRNNRTWWINLKPIHEKQLEDPVVKYLYDLGFKFVSDKPTCNGAWELCRQSPYGSKVAIHLDYVVAGEPDNDDEGTPID